MPHPKEHLHLEEWPVASNGPGVVLTLRGLTKRFGSQTAVDNLDLEIRSGEVLGLLGPNGAGKSTVVGMILGLVKPSRGKVERHGLERARVGAIIENPAFYPFMSGRDNLLALGKIVGAIGKKEVDHLLDLVGLKTAAKKRYGTYSLGMKQRLGLASTLLGDPQLIILDEPTNGLDPAGQQEIRGIIPRLKSNGRAVIVTSHQLHDIEQVSDRVAIMQAGRLRMSGALDDLLGDSTVVELKVTDPAKAASILRGLEGVEAITINNGLVQVRARKGLSIAISRALAVEEIYVESLVEKRESLEDLFFEVTENGEDDR
jgi:ABC-2 type transport system ATP-binding protein